MFRMLPPLFRAKARAEGPSGNRALSEKPITEFGSTPNLGQWARLGGVPTWKSKNLQPVRKEGMLPAAHWN